MKLNQKAELPSYKEEEKENDTLMKEVETEVRKQLQAKELNEDKIVFPEGKKLNEELQQYFQQYQLSYT